MPNAALVAGRQTVIEGLSGGYDAFSATSHKLSTRTGTAPLENGTQITDHAVAAPIELTLEGIVSDLTVNGAGRAREAWSVILKAWKEVNTFRVVTPWVVYPEMIIKEINAPEAGFGFEFTLKLEEIQIVGREEQVPSFQALEPAAQRQPEIQLGTVANVAVPDIDEAMKNLLEDPELKTSNNPLDWYRDAVAKKNEFVGAIADSNLIQEAREISDIFGAEIFGDISEIDDINTFLNGLDAEVEEGIWTQEEADRQAEQAKRGIEYLTNKVNQNTEQENEMLVGYVENNYDPNQQLA